MVFASGTFLFIFFSRHINRILAVEKKISQCKKSVFTDHEFGILPK